MPCSRRKPGSPPLQFGFNPGIGVFHATYQGRDSFSLDLMEPIRPLVDRYVLHLLRDRKFKREDFFETREGICRILPPVAEELSETAVLWRRPLRELTEAVSETLLQAGDQGRRGLLSLGEGHTAHGRELAAALRTFRCSPDSWAETQWKNQLRERHKQSRVWERKVGSDSAEIDYEEEIVPALPVTTNEEIAEATGLSVGYGSEIRNGHKLPHCRHWPALAELAEERRDAAEEHRALKERFADVDFDADIRPVLDEFSLSEISEKTGLSRSYIGEIRRGEKVPSLKCWEVLSNL